jgi:2-oxoglutarate dehydrogenase E2 component (dihydrolipoamide succinyltransferase)
MAEQIDIRLPEDQTEGTTNTVGKWFKAVGEPVALNDPLLEIVTDKVTVEIAAPSAGVLTEILKQEGDSVEPGDVVGRIGSGTPTAGSVGSVSAGEPSVRPSVRPSGDFPPPHPSSQGL